MEAPHIAIVLAPVDPQQREEAAELLKKELGRTLPGGTYSLCEVSGSGPPVELVRRIMAAVESCRRNAQVNGPVYSAEEEEKIRKRLEDLGYI